MSRASSGRTLLPTVQNVTIWGNHSNTQYPDFSNARINGKPALEVITDRAWLENTFVPQCQNRGAAVIKARGQAPTTFTNRSSVMYC